MTTTLIRTQKAQNAEIMATADGNRVTIATCDLAVETYEISKQISILGQRSYSLKKHQALKLICTDIEFTLNIDEEQLRRYGRFEVMADIQRKDGVFERKHFDVLPIEIDLIRNRWEFEANV